MTVPRLALLSALFAVAIASCVPGGDKLENRDHSTESVVVVLAGLPDRSAVVGARLASPYLVGWLPTEGGLRCARIIGDSAQVSTGNLPPLFRPAAIARGSDSTFILTDSQSGKVIETDCAGRLSSEIDAPRRTASASAAKAVGRDIDSRALFAPVSNVTLRGDTVLVERQVVAKGPTGTDTLIGPFLAERKLQRDGVRIPIPLEAPFRFSSQDSAFVVLAQGGRVIESYGLWQPRCVGLIRDLPPVQPTVQMMDAWRLAALAGLGPDSRTYVDAVLQTVEPPVKPVPAVIDIRLSRSGCWVRFSNNSREWQRWVSSVRLR